MILFFALGGLEAVGRLGASDMNPETQILFNPDDVRAITWQVGSNHQTWTREKVADEWTSPTPSSNSNQIQKLLVGLATASSGSRAFAPFHKVLGSVALADGTVSKFKWNGSVFKWTDGPQADKGGRPTPLLQHVLESGRYVGEKPRVSWCTARPKEIRVKGETLRFVIQAGDGGSWLRTSEKEPAHKIDPTAVEKWLGRFCQFEGSFWRDSDVAGRISLPAMFSYELQGGEAGRWNFDSKSAVIQVKSNRAIVSPEFVSALESLAQIP